MNEKHDLTFEERMGAAMFELAKVLNEVSDRLAIVDAKLDRLLPLAAMAEAAAKSPLLAGMLPQE